MEQIPSVKLERQSRWPKVVWWDPLMLLLDERCAGLPSIVASRRCCQGPPDAVLGWDTCGSEMQTSEGANMRACWF